MKDIKDICFIVQARLNSERVPKKMLKPFAGTTLTDLILSKLTACKNVPINQTYLAVHEPELKAIGEKHGVSIFDRSYESANVDNGIQVLFEWWNKLPYKYVVLVSGCNPLLKSSTIDKFIETYINLPEEGLFSVVKKKNYYWNLQGELVSEWPEGQDLLNTKAVAGMYEAGHCLYGSRMASIGEGKWVGSWHKKNDPVLFEVSEVEAFDIDDPWQFDIAELLYKNEQTHKRA